jgi:hypothetical protein
MARLEVPQVQAAQAAAYLSQAEMVLATILLTTLVEI